MTSHEFDAYMDMQPIEHFEPPYHEQLLVMEEFQIARETELKKAGAMEALKELKLYLLVCGIDERCKDELLGLKWSIDAITRRLSDIEVSVTMEGGAV